MDGAGHLRISAIASFPVSYASYLLETPSAKNPIPNVIAPCALCVKNGLENHTLLCNHILLSACDFQSTMAYLSTHQFVDICVNMVIFEHIIIEHLIERESENKL